MTKLLEKAFAEAAKLPEREQEVLASRLLAELGAEDEFDRAIAGSTEKLAKLAREALEEHRAGKTEPLDPGDVEWGLDGRQL
jgi:hypothetical protein